VGVVHAEGEDATAWKDLERRVARALGGERNGPNPGSDVAGTPYSIEVKRMKRLSLRSDHLEQARRQAAAEGKPWLLVIGTHGDRNPVAVVDFKWLAGKLTDKEAA